MNKQKNEQQQVLNSKFQTLHESLKKDADAQAAIAVANLIEQQP